MLKEKYKLLQLSKGSKEEKFIKKEIRRLNYIDNGHCEILKDLSTNKENLRQVYSMIKKLENLYQFKSKKEKEKLLNWLKWEVRRLNYL
jgi:uncharacterized protein YfkK (UPF0435 family)